MGPRSPRPVILARCGSRSADFWADLGVSAHQSHGPTALNDPLHARSILGSTGPRRVTFNGAAEAAWVPCSTVTGSTSAFPDRGKQTSLALARGVSVSAPPSGFCAAAPEL